MIAAPGLASDLVFDPDPTLSCLQQVSDGAQSYDCIGLAASACMAQPMGETTVGMSFCLGEEFDLWDAKLNDAYQMLRADYAAQDAARFEGAPAMVAQLRDMQRAWIGFRDARCGFEAAQWHGGTGASPSFLGCVMQLTADQTLYLWSVFQGGQ
ncbi:MAG: DUF1311 domain-containing protein [Rhodobacteraceae bacterium]|nr:MAG: DUF1311 domain-containing protein [Paracoccaceae bacterium]